MRDIPDYYWEWTEYERYTYNRIIKSDVPPDILKKLIDDERNKFNLTARIGLINVDHETWQLISIEEGVKRYFDYEEEKIKRIREEIRRKKEQS